jgi:ATP-binding cassette subfamily F protein uup
VGTVNHAQRANRREIGAQRNGQFCSGGVRSPWREMQHIAAAQRTTSVSAKLTESKGAFAAYIGGYQDYLLQRPDEKAVDQKADVKKAQAKAEAEKLAAQAATTKKVKLSYKDQRELEQLPAEIENLEAEQSELSEKLADGSWFVKDADAATQASQRLAEIEEVLLEKLERWDELENMSNGN